MPEHKHDLVLYEEGIDNSIKVGDVIHCKHYRAMIVRDLNFEVIASRRYPYRIVNIDAGDVHQDRFKSLDGLLSFYAYHGIHFRKDKKGLLSTNPEESESGYKKKGTMVVDIG